MRTATRSSLTFFHLARMHPYEPSGGCDYEHTTEAGIPNTLSRAAATGSLRNRVKLWSMTAFVSAVARPEKRMGSSLCFFNI